MSQHGHRVAEGEFGIVFSHLEFSDAHAFSRFYAGFSNCGRKNHIGNFVGSGHCPRAHNTVHVNVHGVVFRGEAAHAGLANGRAAVVGDGLVEERGGCAFDHHIVSKEVFSDVAHLNHFGFHRGVFALHYIAVGIHFQFRFALVGDFRAMESGENLVAVFELYAMVAINQRKSGLIFHISAVAILSKHGHGVGKFHVGVVAHSLISGNVCHFGAFAHHVFSHGNVAHLVVERSNSLHSGSGIDSDRIGIHR